MGCGGASGDCWTYQHNVLDFPQAHDDSAALLTLCEDGAAKRIRSADQRGQEDAFASCSRRLICKMEMEMLRAVSSKGADQRSAGFCPAMITCRCYLSLPDPSTVQLVTGTSNMLHQASKHR